MGGCYYNEPVYQSRRSVCSTPVKPPKPVWETSMNKFFKDHELTDLVESYKDFSASKDSGFFQALMSNRGLSEFPKEFPDIEYEVKIEIIPIQEDKTKKAEPGIAKYLKSFDFPPTKNARFLRDSVDAVTVGTNHFFGQNGSERLVVIEKMGKTYLKEKSDPLPIDVEVPGKQIVIKRTEKRYEASMEDIIHRVAEETSKGSIYHGKIHKDKADAFILDTNDGRVYSFTITIANNGGSIQRQLELEYAGYMPGFPAFKKDSEKQIITGMVDLAKLVLLLHQNAPVAPGYRMGLQITHERKYDFVEGKPKQLEQSPPNFLELDIDFSPERLKVSKMR